MKFVLKYLFITFLVFSCGDFLYAQKTLQIIQVRLGSFKKHEFYCGSALAYKLNGDNFYRHSKIANMNDSLILFSNDSVVKLCNIKAIKFKRGDNVMGPFSKLFLKAGIGYVGLNVITNLIYENVFRADPRALYISMGCLAGYMVYNRLNTKRIRVKKNVTLKVLELNFEKLR